MNGFSWSHFEEVPLVGILRGFNVKDCGGIVEHCGAGGLRNLEVTMNSPEAARSITMMRKATDGSMNIGAGTVCSMEDLQTALDAGAQFIITPVVVPEVIKACKERSVPVFPGALTPTEIFTAWNLGADIVKVFPASVVGPGYFRDLRGPLPQIKLMPTGGVQLNTLADYFKEGAVAASIGGKLFNPEHIAVNGLEWLEGEIRKYVQLTRSLIQRA